MREADDPGPDPSGVHHVITVACVVFSFAGLRDKLGKPMLYLHTPVPGYEQALEKVLNKMFTSMQVTAVLFAIFCFFVLCLPWACAQCPSHQQGEVWHRDILA
jgi:hypothetical protein